jgi:hypothetical protein
MRRISSARRLRVDKLFLALSGCSSQPPTPNQDRRWIGFGGAALRHSHLPTPRKLTVLLPVLGGLTVMIKEPVAARPLAVAVKPIVIGGAEARNGNGPKVPAVTL